MVPFLKEPWVKKTLFVFCALVLLSLITPHWWYVGDGHLVDRGFFSYIPRYTLNLGLVDLAQRNTYTYSMVYFPSTELTIGFRIRGHTGTSYTSIGETRPINSTIRLLLRNAEGLPVIDESASMKNGWVWSYGLHDPNEAFVYRRGKTEDVPIAEHTVHVKNIGVKADDGWGTYFTPKFWGRYTLLLEIQEGDPRVREFQVELEAHGGGWMGF